MSASTSNSPSFIVEVRDEYPYPSHVIAPNFVTLKLSNKSKYNVWETQMLCLLSSHDMLGFIDGTFVCPDDDQNGKGKVVGDLKKAWMRSDSLVKGWILGSLTEEAAIKAVNHLTSKHKESYLTAKHAWDELQSRYGPSIVLQKAVAELELEEEREAEEEERKWMEPLGQRTEEEEEREWMESLSQRIYRRSLHGHWHDVRRFIKAEGLAPTFILTKNGNTILHVVVGSLTKNHEIFAELLEMIPKKCTLLDLVNSDGSTLLHVAAIVGNTEAAEILLKRNLDFLLAKDKEGHTPLCVSLSNMHTETSVCLLKYIEPYYKGTKYHKAMFSGTNGDKHLVLAISTKQFRLAIRLLRRYNTIHSEAVLMAIAQNFPCEPNFWERIRAWPFTEDRVEVRHFAFKLLYNVCQIIRATTDSNHCYTNPVFEATRLNAFEVVEAIVSTFPNTIWSTNEDGQNFIQYAVINRSEKIYSLLYQMSEHKNIYRTIKDTYGNNLLHLAARLAPSNKLNLISGAALQLQRELQWYKEVEGFVRPLNKIEKNSSDETPELVFTSQHKELVIDGEKWMKATAESYTITAALITTIVFAAAITVPGGNKDTGVPNFSSKAAFTIFAISDAISLFTAVTSLLMFLSILTTRFAEQDFLFKLPKRLIIGLATLFISTTAMIIAFGATLILVFGERKSWILIPIGVLTCLPITSFVTLQFPLIGELMSTTYGRSIFVKKKSHDYFY